MSSSVRIENALLLTMVDGEAPRSGTVRIEGNIITHVGDCPPDADETVDASGGILLPGFVQTHVHLCQSLFRNMAEDLSLFDWLTLRIWPMEAALAEADMTAACNLGLAEVIRGGTTTILDMGSVHHTDQIGAAVQAAKIRAIIGKALMDGGDTVPPTLKQSTNDCIRESEDLFRRWHGAAQGRLGYALAPRFAPACTTELLSAVSEFCRDNDLIVHTHCAESLEESAWAQKQHGMDYLTYLHQCGLTGPRSVFVHMVHLNDEERATVKKTKTAISHCPSSNCKLASGIAPIPEYLDLGLRVSLGPDGAPCNNTLDMFMEMRLAALIQKPRFGPKTMSAKQVLKLATIGGAEALGLADQTGTLEVGKRADLTHLRLDRPFNGVGGDPYGQIVYTGSRQNVVDVWCDGFRLMKHQEILTVDEQEVVARGKESIKDIRGRL